MEGTSTNPLAEMIPEEGVGLIPYLESLKKVDDIGAETILPGHGAVIKRPEKYISQIALHHDTTARRIRQIA